MRTLRWLRPYRWPLLLSILLHFGFLLLLIGAKPATGSNRKTIVPLLSLNTIPKLGKSQFKRPTSKEQPKEKKTSKKSKKIEVTKTRKDNNDLKPTPPKPQDNSLTKANKQIEEFLDNPENFQTQRATKRFAGGGNVFMYS